MRLSGTHDHYKGMALKLICANLYIIDGRPMEVFKSYENDRFTNGDFVIQEPRDKLGSWAPRVPISCTHNPRTINLTNLKVDLAIVYI